MSTEYKGYRSELSALDAFDEFLDDVYGTSVTVAGYEYCVSRVLKAVDPIAYREEFNNWVDQLQDICEECEGEEPDDHDADCSMHPDNIAG